MSSQKGETIRFCYRFKFPDGSEKPFEVMLDKATLRYVSCRQGSAPSWTGLGFCQCPNCPLDTARVEHCPVAFNLADLIEFFNASLSCDEADVTIETEERTYLKRTSLQRGISSLLGIYMATSGCPILDKLKPMARHHLPFASLEETQYRVLSMYLLAQYFVKKHGEKPDWDLTGLSEIYREIQVVNKAFCQRLQSLKGKDAVPNAVVILNVFAEIVPFVLDQQALQKIEGLFGAYLEK
ncbi:MAG: hypothetical protein HYY44_02685 [Deltaproteobacteria bacterium]|nr:hypothetical protein [Deltaproteobacteria bacterium]MBI4373249.1 hypothetical protein [Deltaproteobacteria bacterium]